MNTLIIGAGPAGLMSAIRSAESGQSVTVLEEIVRNNSGPEEPSAWAKILLPTNTHVWVHTSFINPATKVVVPRKLNVRSGPGENFSVLGMFLRGETVVDAGGAKGSWLEIQPPTNAYAFVAAQYLKQETAPVLPAAPAQPVPRAGRRARLPDRADRSRHRGALRPRPG